jgi:hypothetical protein
MKDTFATVFFYFRHLVNKMFNWSCYNKDFSVVFRTLSIVKKVISSQFFLLHLTSTFLNISTYKYSTSIFSMFQTEILL